MAEEEPQLPKLNIMQTCPIDFGECKKKEEIENEFIPSQVFLDIPYSGYNKEYEKAIRKAIESFGLNAVLKSWVTSFLHANKYDGTIIRISHPS